MDLWFRGSLARHTYTESIYVLWHSQNPSFPGQQFRQNGVGKGRGFILHLTFWVLRSTVSSKCSMCVLSWFFLCWAQLVQKQWRVIRTCWSQKNKRLGFWFQKSCDMKVCKRNRLIQFCHDYSFGKFHPLLCETEGIKNNVSSVGCWERDYKVSLSRLLKVCFNSASWRWCVNVLQNT